MGRLIDRYPEKCPICGFTGKPKFLAFLLSKYTVSRCCNCGVVYVYPQPSPQELQEYYQGYNSIDPAYAPEELIDLHQAIIDYLLRRLKRSKNIFFLDYGFGNGAFLKLVAKKGFYAYGIDVDNKACERMREYCKNHRADIGVINILKEPLEKLANNKFDCITLFNTIEHCLDPLGTIVSLASLQKPGGLLYIECPNNDALFFKFKNAVRFIINRRDFYYSLNPPPHIYGFNRRSIEALLRRAGYAPIEIGDYYLCDGVHQVEDMFCYISFRELIKKRTDAYIYFFFKFLARIFDPLFSKLLRSGAGLYALAVKSK